MMSCPDHDLRSKLQGFPINPCFPWKPSLTQFFWNNCEHNNSCNTGLREQKTAATDCQLPTRCTRFDKMLRTNRGSSNSMRGLNASSPLVWALVSEKLNSNPKAHVEIPAVNLRHVTSRLRNKLLEISATELGRGLFWRRLFGCCGEQTRKRTQSFHVCIAQRTQQQDGRTPC